MGIFQRFNCDNCNQYRRRDGQCSCGGVLLPGDWYATYKDAKGKERTEKAGNKARAETLARLREGQHIEDAILTDLADDFFKARRTGTAKAELRSWKGMEQHFKVPAYKLDRQLIRSYIQHRRSGGISDASIEREISILRGVYRLAYPDGALINPFENLGVKRKRRKINKYFRGGEWELLEEHLPAQTRPYYTFLHETAARANEARLLEWKNVDLDRRIAWVYGKTADGELEPLVLSNPAVDMLRVMQQEDGLVFKNKDGGMVVCPRTQIVERAGKCGLNDTLRKTGRDPINGTHWLRHAAISRWVMAGVGLETVAKLARHKRIQQTYEYAHLAPDVLHDAINRR